MKPHWRRRTGLIATLAAAAVAVPVALWVVSSAGVTPEQRVADAEAPPPAVVDVAIERKRLSDVVVFRGVVTAVDEQAIWAPQLEGRLAVVIALPVAVGDQVAAGDVVAVVADRPVIAVAMPVPLYRTLTPSLEGDDVSRYQRSLGGLGYDVAVTGTFDLATQQATRALYEDRGFAPLTTGEDLDEAWRSARAAVSLAESALQAALQSGDMAAASQARHELQAAEDARDQAAAKVGVIIPLGEVLGVGALPVVVSSVTARVGTVADGPILAVTGSDLVIEATVDLTLAPLLAPGVQATAGDQGWRVEVESNEGRDDTGRPIVRLRAVDPLPAELLGRDLRVEAVLAATEGPVLAVPVAAIRAGDDGPIVRVVSADGTVTAVGVRTGASIGGWVEIVDADENLTPGIMVRLG